MPALPPAPAHAAACGMAHTPSMHSAGLKQLGPTSGSHAPPSGTGATHVPFTQLAPPMQNAAPHDAPTAASGTSVQSDVVGSHSSNAFRSHCAFAAAQLSPFFSSGAHEPPEQ